MSKRTIVTTTERPNEKRLLACTTRSYNGNHRKHAYNISQLYGFCEFYKIPHYHFETKHEIAIALLYQLNLHTFIPGMTRLEASPNNGSFGEQYAPERNWFMDLLNRRYEGEYDIYRPRKTLPTLDYGSLYPNICRNLRYDNTNNNDNNNYKETKTHNSSDSTDDKLSFNEQVFNGRQTAGLYGTSGISCKRRDMDYAGNLTERAREMLKLASYHIEQVSHNPPKSWRG